MDENLNELIILANNLYHYPRLTNHLTVALEQYIFPIDISCQIMLDCYVHVRYPFRFIVLGSLMTVQTCITFSQNRVVSFSPPWTCLRSFQPSRTEEALRRRLRQK
jgi:hypothetical protein